jgi:hypothetical protein
MRKAYGAFKGVDRLSAIRGIVPKRLEKNAQIAHRLQDLKSLSPAHLCAQPGGKHYRDEVGFSSVTVW